MKYLVRSDSDRVVDYLGVFEAGEPRELTQDEVDSWLRSRGVPLNQASMPEGVELVVVVMEEKE